MTAAIDTKLMKSPDELSEIERAKAEVQALIDAHWAELKNVTKPTTDDSQGREARFREMMTDTSRQRTLMLHGMARRNATRQAGEVCDMRALSSLQQARDSAEQAAQAEPDATLRERVLLAFYVLEEALSRKQAAAARVLA